MDLSKSKRHYHDQDYDSKTLPRSAKQRYNSGTHSTTSYNILCHHEKAGVVIGKSGSTIKAIRELTGAWIRIHELIPGDEERSIQISDTRRQDPEGRMPLYSPAQEALFLIHERILKSGAGGYVGGEDDVDYGWGGGSRVATRLLVPRMRVGCLLGKGGKIIEQMGMETKTHITILPRDHSRPRCDLEEIVQVVGDIDAVKSAISIISSRLRESQYRDRTNFHGQLQSPEQFFPPDDDFIPHMNNTPRRTSVDGFGPRSSGGLSSGRSNNYNPRSSGYEIESGAAPSADNAQLFSGDKLVFQILCPIDKVDSVVGESDGIIELLQNKVGVDVKVADPVAGSNEQIIIISSEEGPDDELFPAQEALLHIQTRIVDLVSEKENIITTRLVVPSDDIGCLEGRDGSLAEIRRLTGANIQILHREELPVCVSGTDHVVQAKPSHSGVAGIKRKLEAPLTKNANKSEAFVEENDPLDKKFESGPFGYKQIPDRAINSKQQYGERSNHWNAPYDGFQGGSGSLPPNPGEWKRLTPELHPPSVTEEWRWKGIIKMGGTPVCQARCFPVGKALGMPLPEYLDCTSRTGLDMLEQHYYRAVSAWVVVFVPGSDADIGHYNEFMKYLEKKQRATVVKLDESTTLFLVPPSEFSEKVLKVPGKLSISGVVLRLEHPGPNQGSSLPHPPVKKETNLMSYRGDASYPKPTSPPPGQFPLAPFQNVQENTSSSYTPTSPGMMGTPLGGASKSSHQQTTPQVSSSAPVSGLQPGKLVQLASSLLGQPRQSGGGPPLSIGGEFRQSGFMNHSENSYGTPQRYTPQNNQFGQVQPQQQQQQASNVAARNQQMQSGKTQEEHADPQQHLQAMLQRTTALLAQIQQGKGN